MGRGIERWYFDLIAIAIAIGMEWKGGTVPYFCFCWLTTFSSSSSSLSAERPSFFFNEAPVQTSLLHPPHFVFVLPFCTF